MLLDRQIQFYRATLSDSGVSDDEEFTVLGGLYPAAKKEVSDSERLRAGEVGAMLSCRFTVRYSEFTRGITPKDRLVCEGISYDISGIKEVGERRTYLEITAAARTDKL